MLETVSLRGRRIAGFGTRALRSHGLGQDVTQDPGYQAAWGTIQQQLQTEGASSIDVQGASAALQDSWHTLVTTGGMNGGDALVAATKYVLHGQTIAGAADQVAGLVQAGLSGAPAAGLMQAFTGTMIGGLVAAGAVSAGLGAAIVAGVGVVVSLLQDAGLFGSPPQGQQYCPGQYLQGGTISYLMPGQVNPDTGQMNCIGVIDPYAPTGQGIGTDSSRWRHFPLYVSANPSDVQWFMQTLAFGGGQLSWIPHPGEQPLWFGFGPGLLPHVPAGSLGRPIDAAFPIFHQIECEAAAGAGVLMLAGVDPRLIPALTSFQQAWWSALKLNWEYALNGLKPQEDWQTLAHHVRMWNRSHDGSVYYDLAPSGAVPWTYNGTTCSGFPPWYAQIACSGIVSNPLSDIMAPSNAAVRIHCGPAKNYSLSGINAAGGGSSAATPSTSSSSGKVVLVAGAATAAGAGGLYWYARKHGLTMGQALRQLFHG